MLHAALADDDLYNLHFLGNLPNYGSNTSAQAVNDHNTVVGFATATNGDTRAFFWDQLSVTPAAPIALSNDNGIWLQSKAFAISTYGKIAGTVSSQTRTWAAYWPNTSAAPIQLPDGGNYSRVTGSEAHGVSDDGLGIVAGWLQIGTLATDRVACAWVNGNFVDLHASLSALTGNNINNRSWATAASGRNIVGGCDYYDDSGHHRIMPVKWEGSGNFWIASFVQLPFDAEVSYSRTTNTALGVNEAGDICGVYSSNQYQGRDIAFVLINMGNGVMHRVLPPNTGFATSRANALDNRPGSLSNLSVAVVGEFTDSTGALKPFFATDFTDSQQDVMATPVSTNDRGNGYFEGLTNRALGISNVQRYSDSNRTWAVGPSIAMQGTSTSGSNTQAVVGRAKISENNGSGVETMGIGRVRIVRSRPARGGGTVSIGTLGSLNAGEPISLTVHPFYLTYNNSEIKDVGGEDRRASWDVHFLGAGGRSSSGQELLIARGASQTQAVNIDTVRDDAGRTVQLDGSVYGESLAAIETVSINSLETRITNLTLTPDNSLLGSPVTLKARLEYFFIGDQGWHPFDIGSREERITFSVSSDGSTWMPAGSAPASPQDGYASAQFTLPALLGVGTKFLRAEYFATNSAYPHFNDLNGTTRVSQRIQFTTRSSTRLLVPTPIYADRGEPIRVSAVLLADPGFTPVPGQTLAFTVNGLSAGSAITDGFGIATVVYTVPTNSPSIVPVVVDFASQNGYGGNSSSGQILIHDTIGQLRLENSILVAAGGEFSGNANFVGYGDLKLQGSFGEPIAGGIMSDGRQGDIGLRLNDGFWPTVTYRYLRAFNFLVR